MTSAADGKTAVRVHALIGWLSVFANLAYSVCSYYGFAPAPGGWPTEWWHGRGFVLDWESMGGYVDSPIRGALIWAIPAAVICVATFSTLRSSVARWLSLSLTFASFLYAAAGFTAGSAWLFFGWRFTAVVGLAALSIAATLTSALLVKSWLRLAWPARIAIYLPIFVAVMAAVRGATGTNPALRFSLSPWPIFTTIGLETVVFLSCGFLFATALGVLALARGSIDGVSRLGLLLAIALPGVWVSLRVPGLSIPHLLAMAFVTAAMIGLVRFFPGSATSTGELIAMRGLHLALGTALVFIPVFAGHALAQGDFAFNRHVLSTRVIRALDAHIRAKEFYPEKLEDLVGAGFLDQEPRPRIGFGFLEPLGLSEPVAYRYNEYGSSYVLEFDSTYWVQCQLSGNYYFDDDEDRETDDGGQDEPPEWSCLNKRPALLSTDEVDPSGREGGHDDR